MRPRVVSKTGRHQQVAPVCLGQRHCIAKFGEIASAQLQCGKLKSLQTALIKFFQKRKVVAALLGQ